MRRRALLAAVAVAGCGLSERPYAERRAWPLDVRRPTALPARPGGKVLLVRGLRSGPGMEARGLQTVRTDGSIKTDFYEEWAVSPAEAAEDALRRWLADAGLFAAVTAPGSRAEAELTLEGELDALWTVAAEARARAALDVTVLAARDAGARVLVQRSFAGVAPVANGQDAPARATAMRAALADAFGRIEAALAAVV